MLILSKSNPQVKELRALREKKARKEAGSFLVEGEKMVKECLLSGIRVKRIVAREDYRGELAPDLVLGSDAFSSISEEKTPQPVLAEAELPHTSLAALFWTGCKTPPTSAPSYGLRTRQGIMNSISSAAPIPFPRKACARA